MQNLFALLLTASMILGTPPRHMKIYFANFQLEGEAQAKGDSTATPVGVFPVDRTVPITPTIKLFMQHLVQGPTPAEREAGYSSGLDGLRIDRVSFANGTATIRLIGRLNLAGVLSGPRLRMQVNRTILQLPNVKQVDLFINGKREFDSLK